MAGLSFWSVFLASLAVQDQSKTPLAPRADPASHAVMAEVSRFFDDLPVGFTIETGSQTLTEEAITAFAT